MVLSGKVVMRHGGHRNLCTEGCDGRGTLFSEGKSSHNQQTTGDVLRTTRAQQHGDDRGNLRKCVTLSCVVWEMGFSTALILLVSRQTLRSLTLTYYPRGPPLWSSGQSFWPQIHRSRVRFPALPDFLSSSGSGTGPTQPREVNWGAT